MGCIYMYTNLKNGMRYIGQTIRPLRQRDWEHWNRDNSYIDRALRKEGKENFSLKILADNINDRDKLNELEKYYIQYYDTYNNGYNLTTGGDNGKRFNPHDRKVIGHLITTTNFSLAKIAEITGYSIYTISDINIGNIAPIDGETYPLRKRRCTEKFSEDDIANVIYYLQNSNFSFKKIADLTNTNFYFVEDINRGKRIFQNKYKYSFPLRAYAINRKKNPVTLQMAQQVIVELKKMDKSNEEIGQLFGLPGYTIGQINRGKLAICKEISNESFPIRKTPYRNPIPKNRSKITQKQLQQVIDFLLNTQLSMTEIGKRVNLSRTEIGRINKGEVFTKQLSAKYKLPIRQNKTINLQKDSVKE